MKIIYTRKGQEILVDAEWYEMLNAVTWHITVSGYANRNATVINGVTISAAEKMHRLILDKHHIKCSRFCIDHINGNKLDNRKVNLRVFDISRNAQNARNKNNTSGYRGVSIDNKSGLFVAMITKNLSQKCIGLYSIKEIAAWAYNLEAKKLFGNDARMNKIVVGLEEIFKT